MLEQRHHVNYWVSFSESSTRLKRMSVSQSQTEWLFGYGSIINNDSRKGTSNTFEAYPARIYGYQRKWDDLYHGVGIIQSKEIKDSVNGVLSRISNGSIGNFDSRECPYGM